MIVLHMLRPGADGTVMQRLTGLAEMGHAWPGAAGDDPMAAPDAPISASELLWEFFEAHPRRR